MQTTDCLARCQSPLTISRAGKPSKPRIAERDANGNLSFLHRLQVVSVPLLTGDVIGENEKMKKVFIVCLFITSSFFHPWDSNPRPLDYEATALPTELLCLSTSQGVKTYLFKFCFCFTQKLEKFLQVLFQRQEQASQANRKLLSEMPMTISRAGKPSKPRIAERDANVNLSFLHHL